jgi:membrane protease subunit (stomatin/prohibitin family)
MGLWDRVKGQFIEVIEWLDDSADTMVYRFPVANQEIKMGAKLTVRETQVAVFFNQGKIADVFQPGMYTLSTNNLPILTTLMSWATGFNSPFKAEVYFFNTKQFTDLKWGTSNPVTVRDPEIGPVRVRAFGSYAMRMKDPAKLLKQAAGTNGLYKTSDIEGQLTSAIVTRFSTLVSESRTPFLDMAGKLGDLSAFCREKLAETFDSFGLELSLFMVENVSLPPEVEKVLDRRSGMGIVSDIGKYAQFQAADAIKDAAQNTGGGAGAGVGLGAGLAMGQSMVDAIKGGSAPAQNRKACARCQKSIDAAAKFCPDCGAPQN